MRRNKEGVQLLPFKSYLLLKQTSETQAYFVLDNHAREVFSLPYAHLIVFPKIAAERSTGLLRIHDKKETFFKLLAPWYGYRIMRREKSRKQC